MSEKVDIYAKRHFRVRANEKVHARLGPHVTLELSGGARRTFVAPGQKKRVRDEKGGVKFEPIEAATEHVIECDLVTASQLRLDGYEVTEISAEDAAAAAPAPKELPKPEEATSVAEAAAKAKK